MAGATGCLSFVLHAHLPYVRQEKLEDFLEEDWFHEAALDSYAPLLMRFEALAAEGIPFGLGFSLSAPVISMAADPLMQARLSRYIDRRRAVLSAESASASSSRVELARHYLAELDRVEHYIRVECSGNLLNGFRRLGASGHLELMTTAGTHGFLPLMSSAGCWMAQIRSGLETFHHHFGSFPSGFWLPECGYTPGIEDILESAGVSFTIVDTHTAIFGHPRPVWAVYSPVLTGRRLSAFPRDPESGRAVWSQDEGYPGDPDYREFYRDAGFDAPEEVIAPFSLRWVGRRGVGVKYHRITGSVPLEDKELYAPAQARAKALLHAEDFVEKRARALDEAGLVMGRPAVATAPFDAELFGHWWHEGPDFLSDVLRLAARGGRLECVSPAEYQRRYPVQQKVELCASSWGNEGYSSVWLSPSNAWMYRHLRWAEERMLAAVRRTGRPSSAQRRVLNLLLRELLLMQSSDWAFILTAGTAVEYARGRFEEHYRRFRLWLARLVRNKLDVAVLAQAEAEAPLFPRLDYRWLIIDNHLF